MIALYNPPRARGPGSSARRWSCCAAAAPATPVVFARAVGRPDEAHRRRSLAEADPAAADMATLVHHRLERRPGCIERPGAAAVGLHAAQHGAGR